MSLADEVGGFDPIAFAVAFTRAMRKQKTAAFTPSLRTSLAIPRLLSARWARTGALSPRDFLEAAVWCTPLEDQDLAEAVARALLFPEADDDAPEVAVAETEATDIDVDALSDILGDMAALDLDGLGDLSDIDALLAADDPLDGERDAFELFESLYASADPAERSLGELVHACGGPAELEASGIRTVGLLRVWVARQLLGQVGELVPDLVFHGVRAGYGPDLERACAEPWELAGVLAGSRPDALQAHLDDVLAAGSCRELGRTLAFLGPHAEVQARRDAFSTAALARALDLTDLAELAVGLGEWIDPDDALLDASIRVHARRTLDAASWLEQVFGIDLRPDLFGRWLGQNPRPDLEVLSVVVVACEAWEEALDGALALELERLDAVAPDGLERALVVAVGLAGGLVATELPKGGQVARALATELMERVPVAALFLPLLDALIERGAPPHSLERVLSAGRALQIPDEEVYDRLGKALEQLRHMIEQDDYDALRYQRLVDRISGMPGELMQQLCAIASGHGNLESMAALIAVCMGDAAGHLSDAELVDACGHKGIGGGRNLLVQWFSHRSRLSGSVLQTIKAQAKAVLMNEAFSWMGKGGGSGQQGLVAQNRTRPFRAGDELEALDLDSTLEAIIASGRSLDQITEDDLYAGDTARGRAALCVLIDISGSMSGKELAVCAIAVVMLLGRLLPQEVALALFESDSHVVKQFADDTDLDEVADEVLDLYARGGTRVEAALSWAADEFASVPEADTRVLFLLSDFCFFEGEQALKARGAALAACGARLLAAAHGFVDQRSLDTLLGAIGGEHLKLTNVDRLPALLLDCLNRIGDG